MKHIVVLSGAGISAESGLKTFRDSGGLWEGFDVMEVASKQGWQKNPEKVLEFYNLRRAQAWKAEPNDAHYHIAKLEEHFKVTVVTQNVDQLHERAGSSKVIHLHGELSKVRSLGDSDLIYDVQDRPINMGDTCEKGHQLRPHIVWFGEEVPMMEKAIQEAECADIFIIIGTSLSVYPAAGLVNFVRQNVPIWLIDPNELQGYLSRNVHWIKAKATDGMKQVYQSLLTQA